MTELPPPATDPDAFLRAVLRHDDRAQAAGNAGCVVHPLGDVRSEDAAKTGALHAAGARAIAASLAREAQPIVLMGQAGAEAAAYAKALGEGLMGYERIFALVVTEGAGFGAVDTLPDPARDGLAMILILPPVEANRYWSR